VTNGTALGKPYQLHAASNEAAGGTRTGHLSAVYDDAGNLASMAVLRRGPCLPVGAVCGQRFVYEWDEVGRLARARRWDVADPGAASAPVPTSVPNAELRYAYDSGDQRVIKSAVAEDGEQRHTLYPLVSLEVRRTTWESGSNRYREDASTQVPYLFAHGVRLARVTYEDADTPSPAPMDWTAPRLHVFIELPDHLGSAATVIDKATSEVVERGMYQAYGAAESDYRPRRWKAFREDHRFTGKEDDVEVGLQYFGFRYFAPLLGRWTSPDPLAVHGLGADLNVYAYVGGRPLAAIDPFGLEPIPSGKAEGQIENGSASGTTGSLAPKPKPPGGPGTASGTVNVGPGSDVRKQVRKQVADGIRSYPRPKPSKPIAIAGVEMPKGLEEASSGREFLNGVADTVEGVPDPSDVLLGVAVPPGGGKVAAAEEAEGLTIAKPTVSTLETGSVGETCTVTPGGDGITAKFVRTPRADNGALPRFDGPKPTYEVNSAHVPGQGLRASNPKTPLPADAEAVFKKAVPDAPIDPKNWYGKNADGGVYRFSGAGGKAHFSGINGVGSGTRNITGYAEGRLREKVTASTCKPAPQ
jgi:RHS repeat-associated protein